MTVRILDLVDRLRGLYILKVDDGAGLLDGKDHFIKNYPNNIPEQLMAADLIDKIRNGDNVNRDQVQTLINQLKIEKDWIGYAGKNYVAPINLEAVDELENYLLT